jgi:DNA-binding GntR family transcriptional regulator
MTESARVYTALRTDIISGEYAPGAAVSEAELCGRYQTSRTPVREACRHLQEESLLLIEPFRGYFIAPLTVAEFRSLHEVLLVIDPAVAALAAERATSEQIHTIEKWANYEYHQGQRTSYYTFLEWNQNLHIEIAAASGNEMFAEITANIQARLIRYFYQVISMDSYGVELANEHREIVKAIRAHKPDLARQKAADHMRRTIERTMIINFTGLKIGVSSSLGTNFEKYSGARQNTRGRLPS